MSNWKVEVDRATSAEWSQMIDLFDDANIYQTAAYGEVHWGGKNLSRIVLKRDGEVVGIAQIRVVRPTPLKFGMAYLRWGPLWERRGMPLDSEVPLRMARAIEDEYLKARKLFVRILPNAFVGSPRAEAFQAAFSGFSTESGNGVETYRTFVLDLTQPLDDLRRKLDKKWRNQLSRAEKNGLTMTAGDGVGDFRTFLEMYGEMYKRKVFKTTVDAQEFMRMQQELPESQRMRVLICREEGMAVAGVVASAMGDSAIYLLGATSDAGLNAKGAYFLQWTLISWLKGRGVKSYDLGGIDPVGNPGVYHFKKGFSGADVFQIEPFAASNSAVSSGMARAGLTLQRRLRASLKPLSVQHSRF
jgi:lipid II:glycine glycyltransferase (peptidoglycan interpeptide bridge formation enzyme)